MTKTRLFGIFLLTFGLIAFAAKPLLFKKEQPKLKPVIQTTAQVTVVEEPIVLKPQLHLVEEYLNSLNIPIDMTDMQAIAWVESRYDRHLIGGDGELGMLQIMPSTWNMSEKWLKKWRPEMLQYIGDWRDPQSNIIVSMTTLCIMKDELEYNGYKPDKAMLLTAYNMGTGGCIRHYSRGRCLPQYTQKVLNKSNELRSSNEPNKLMEMLKG